MNEYTIQVIKKRVNTEDQMRQLQQKRLTLHSTKVVAGCMRRRRRRRSSSSNESYRVDQPFFPVLMAPWNISVTTSKIASFQVSYGTSFRRQKQNNHKVMIIIRHKILCHYSSLPLLLHFSSQGPTTTLELLN